MRKNRILLFICACIPGCGQMYQGYMKRGISMAAAVCLDIGAASFLNLGELAIVLPVLWLYAFFDTWNLRAGLDGGTAQPDGYLFGLSGADAEKLASLARGRHSLVGWCLVVLGLYALLQSCARALLNLYGSYWEMMSWVYYFIRDDLPRLAATVGVIALGVWFIRGPKTVPPEEGYQPYAPPRNDFGQAEPVTASPAEDGAASGDSGPEGGTAEQEDGHGAE